MVYQKADGPAWGGQRPNIGGGVNFLEDLQKSFEEVSA